MRFRLAVSFLVAAALLAGCGGYVGRARREYGDGRYLEAAERLSQHEGELSELPPRRQAEYGVYRGLSLMMLGDYAGAHQWLTFAYGVERQNPGALKPEQRGELDRGWAQLAHSLAPQLVPAGAIVVPAPAVPGGRPGEPPPAADALAP